MKNKQAGIEVYYNLAKSILYEMGVISICESCGIYYFDTNSFEKSIIYPSATNRLKKEYPEYKDFSTFHNQIYRIMKEAGVESTCPHCWKG